MIEAHLNKMHLTPRHCQELRRKMLNTTMLARTLNEHQALQEVLALLYAELTGDNRPSVVSRIHSRYKVLSPTRDTEAMQLWAKKKILSRRS